jgi:hypothetical protein
METALSLSKNSRFGQLSVADRNDIIIFEKSDVIHQTEKINFVSVHLDFEAKMQLMGGCYDCLCLLQAPQKSIQNIISEISI